MSVGWTSLSNLFWEPARTARKSKSSSSSSSSSQLTLSWYCYIWFIKRMNLENGILKGKTNKRETFVCTWRPEEQAKRQTVMKMNTTWILMFMMMKFVLWINPPPKKEKEKVLELMITQEREMDKNVIKEIVIACLHLGIWEREWWLCLSFSGVISFLNLRLRGPQEWFKNWLWLC